MKFNNDIATKSTSSTIALEALTPYNTTFFDPNKLTMVFLESGKSTLMIGNDIVSTSTPGIVFLNETEKLTITHSTNLQGKVLSFNPADLQENFTFENIRTFDHSFTPNDIYIVLLLSVFFQRFSYYNGYIPISEPSLKQLSKLLDELSHHIAFGYPASPTIIEILKYTKRLVQTNMSLSNVIITETIFEIKDVLLYLHNNCKQKITIPILSKHFHINRTTLSDRFYEATGETIITYLNKYRINLAAIMLRETNNSISSIAEEVGFNDTAYFAKLFKKYMLHTPSGYRQHYFSLCQVHKSDEYSTTI